MFKHLAVLAAALVCSGLAHAADLEAKKAKALAAPAPAPAPVVSPFWIGLGAGVGMSPTQNELTFAGISTGQIKGFPTGALVGPSFGYTTNAGNLVYGFAVNAYYDFSRGCTTDVQNLLPCVAGRKNGFLLEEALELGLSLSSLNSSLPQPLPAPGGLPTSMWSAINAKVRAGFAERNVDLCAFDPASGTSPCGSKFIAAPFLGLLLDFQATTNSTIGAKWDHIFWGNQNNQSVFDFVPTAAAPLFSNVIAAKNEDIFTVEWRYHLGTGTGFLGL